MKTVHKVEKAEDLNDLKVLTNGIIGELCWNASLTYPEVPELHIGARIPNELELLKDKDHGAWIILCWASTWKIVSPTETLMTSEHKLKEIKQGLQAIQDTHVVAFEPQYPGLGLIVTFSNGNQLILIPKDDDDVESDQDETEVDDRNYYWELFTPLHFTIEAGPGNKWAQFV